MISTEEALLSLLSKQRYAWVRSLAAFAFGAICTSVGAAWTVRGYADQLATKQSVEQIIIETRLELHNLENQTSAIRERLAIVETKTAR